MSRLLCALTFLLCLGLAAPASAVDISGLVFEDLDRDGVLDLGEPATGQTLYAKLVVSGGASALQAVPVDLVTGTYTLTGVAAGTYDVRIDDNATLSDVTPSVPGTWGFIAPFLGSQSVTVAATNVTAVDFAMEAAPPCACGFQDGLFTLTSITPDGDMSDWSSVLTDRDNVDCDPTGSTDRDHIVQSTGRDLIQFTVTWNGASLFTHTRRVGSSNNTINFIYYADTNANGLMELNEPVIVAGWKGSNRQVDLYYGDYNPSASGGDPLLDPLGFGDGYQLPGTILNLPSTGNPDASGTTGSADGRSMEWGVPWGVLGVPAGTAIGWHVAATNAQPGAGSFPGQVDDNLAGCGGCAGGNQFAGVTLQPDDTDLVAAGQTAITAHQVTNTGNGDDTFDLTSADVAPGTITPTAYRYYEDLGVVGTYEPGTDTLLVDTDGDGVPDTGTLAAGASLAILVATDIPAGGAGTSVIETTATSSFLAACGVAAPTSDTVTDTVTVIATFSASGSVYADTDHDGLKDPGESGTGLILWAKRYATSSPTGPATEAVAVDPTTGLYTFPSVPPGTYDIVIDDNANLADVTPAVIPGWIGTEESDLVRQAVVMGAADLPNLNFGLFNGSQVTGTVYADDGTGAGGAGNGTRDGGEGGIGGVTVQATSAGCGALCASTTTAADGTFTLWLPAATNGTVVTIAEQNLAGYASTGGDAGTTAGTYDLPTDTIVFTDDGTGPYSGLEFGDLSGSQFSPDHQGNALPGSVVFYPHTFIAVADGAVTFAATSAPSPAVSGWAHAIYHDIDCSGTLDASEPLLTASTSIAVSAAVPTCIVIRESVPPTAPTGGQDVLTVTASFLPGAGSSPEVLQAMDITTVGASTGGALALVKAVDQTTALPATVLVYTVTFTNQGTSPLSNLVVYDATPSFTTYVGGSAQCVLPLPANLTTCTPSAPAGGGTGQLSWTFTGTLAPGRSGSVQYSVTID